jgi:hypothetical protein
MALIKNRVQEHHLHVQRHHLVFSTRAGHLQNSDSSPPCTFTAPTLNGYSFPNVNPTSDLSTALVEHPGNLGIFPPSNEIPLPYSPSVSYTFILLRETLASATALTEKGKIAIENFITLNMAMTLNA